MKSKYIITYKSGGAVHKTEWVASSETNARAHFEMFCKGVEVTSVEKAK